MEKAIVGNLTPEEEELEKKKAELFVLKNELIQGNLDLATLQASQNRRKLYRKIAKHLHPSLMPSGLFHFSGKCDNNR